MRSSLPPPAETTSSVVPKSSALAHPLPAGMRDLLPGEATDRALLVQDVLDCFELFGYELVTVPMFEYAEVLERGLGTLDMSEVLRFVEPETGAVVALRPDMTPQIARLLSTRLGDAPMPARLCYQGSVLRRRRERARRHRQIPQCGIELIGSEGLTGDLEVLSVATAAVRASGLNEFVIDLGHVGIASALLNGLAPEQRSNVIEALGLRDARETVLRAERAGLRGPELQALASLPELHGGDEIWSKAEAVLSSTPAASAMKELRALYDAASPLGLRLLVDFAETRDFAYYTGVVFHMHAEGPGQPIGAGGRYDSLYSRFGAARRAAGFAFRLDDLRWALEAKGVMRALPARVLVENGDSVLLGELRARGIRAAAAPSGDAGAYAKAWRFTHIVASTPQGPCLVTVGTGIKTSVPIGKREAAEAIARTVAAGTPK